MKPWLVGIALCLTACAAAPVPAPPTVTLRPVPAATVLSAGSGATPSAAATPVIIASPTPAPTPVTHVVQSGETLLAIALNYGVSLDALLEANPGVQAEFLSVGALLVIPANASETGGSVPALGAVPSPEPLNLSLPDCHPLANGTWACFLSASNPGQVALEAVTARVTLAGSDGLPLAEAVAYPALGVVRPGTTVPLAALFPAAPASAAAIGVTPLTALPLADPDSRYLPLDVTTDASQPDGAAWTVTGQVRNPSGLAAAEVRVAVVLYDGDERLVGYRLATLEGGLPAGETRPFSLTAVALSGTPTRFAALAEGRP